MGSGFLKKIRRLFGCGSTGKKILTIEHEDYVVNAAQHKGEGGPLDQEARARAGVDGN